MICDNSKHLFDQNLLFIHCKILHCVKGISKGVSEVSGHWSDFFLLEILVAIEA